MSTRLPNFHTLTPQQRAEYKFSPEYMKQWERADALRNAGATDQEVIMDARQRPDFLQAAELQAFRKTMELQATRPMRMAENELRAAREQAAVDAMRGEAAKLRAGQPVAKAPVTCPNCGHSFVPNEMAKAAPPPKPAIQAGRAYPTPSPG